MIGTESIDISVLIYSVMLGLVWILFDSAYDYVTGNQEIVQLNESTEEETDCDVAESEQPLGQQLKTENQIRLFCKSYLEEAGSVDPVKYVVSENIAGIKFLLASPTNVAQNAIELVNLTSESLHLTSESLSLKSELQNNIPLFINKEFCMLSYDINTNRKNVWSLKKQHNSLQEDLNKELQISTNLKNKFLKLNHNQILRLQKMAQCFIQHFKLENDNRPQSIKYAENTSLEETLDASEIVPSMVTKKRKRSSTTDIVRHINIVSRTNLLGYNRQIVLHTLTSFKSIERIDAQKRNQSKKRYITQLDLTENSIIPCKQMKFNKIETYNIEKCKSGSKRRKPQKKQKKDIKNQRNNNEKVFSSKICLSRMSLFMRTNKGYTRSKMIMEIEKELEPIKDQISELRETMADFNVINYCFNKKGLKSNILSLGLQLVNRSNLKSKRPVLTVPSAHYTSLSGFSNIFEVYNPEIKTGLIQRSPLAEMYVKLSKY